MNSQTQRSTIQGPTGLLEIAIDLPDADVPPRGMALICHPHPLHGGTLDNKVVQTVGRAFVLCGWRVVRFNFRGVGASQGAWDNGLGEIEDALAVLQNQRQADEPLALGGFSFGGYVASQVQARLPPKTFQHLVLVGPATKNFAVAPVPVQTLVVHGEADDVVPLSATLDWARPQKLPVVVIPGVGHFFHGQLLLLRSLVVRHLCVALSNTL
jgi:alpha/beta superfamily hydrolase